MQRHMRRPFGGGWSRFPGCWAGTLLVDAIVAPVGDVQSWSLGLHHVGFTVLPSSYRDWAPVADLMPSRPSSVADERLPKSGSGLDVRVLAWPCMRRQSRTC